MSNALSNSQPPHVDVSLLEKSPPSASDNLNLSSPKSTTSSKKSPSDSANRRKRKPKKVANIESNLSEDVEMASIPPQINPVLNAIASKEMKTDSDDCETIDKIAQMVSNFTSSPPVAPQITSTTKSPPPQANVNEVENRLEEMFSEPLNPAKIADASQSNSKTEEKPQEKSQKPKPRKRGGRKKQQPDGNAKKKKGGTASVNGKASGSGNKPGTSGKKGKHKDEASPKKKGQKKSKENGGKAKIRADVAPYLQIQNDGSFNIINQTINGEEDGEKMVAKSKKSAAPVQKHKGIRGLHVSTLSHKYDLEKRDTNWMCVFCKLGPHKHKLGDLFGPYIVTKNSKEYAFCLEDPANDVFRQSNRNKFAPVSPPPTQPPAKKKRKISESARKLASPTTSNAVSGPEASDEVYTGMTQLDEQSYEIWFHEDCIVWSPGTHIIGTKIIGLEQAVWQSTRYRCVYCQKNGANVSCLTRGCHKEAHIVCARKNWKLCDDFKTYCEQHVN